jgi:hypothetical protein
MSHWLGIEGTGGVFSLICLIPAQGQISPIPTMSHDTKACVAVYVINSVDYYDVQYSSTILLVRFNGSE